jgi:hypothetical protein
MTFLSSRVMGRGSAALPAVDALITDAFLLIFRYRRAAGLASVAGWQDAPPKRGFGDRHAQWGRRHAAGQAQV